MSYRIEVAIPEIAKNIKEEVYSLLQESYGEHFKRDTVLRGMTRATKLINLRDPNEKLVATASLEGNRIALVGTSTSPECDDPRAQLGIRLMEACKEDGDAQWVSIGMQHRLIRVGASTIGMQRVIDPEYAAKLIANPLRDNQYDIVNSEDEGLLLVSGPNLTNPGYKQQIWSWDKDS